MRPGIMIGLLDSATGRVFAATCQTGRRTEA